MSKPRFTLLGHAHIDPVWLWPWTEGCAEVLATFRSALDRMKEFDDWKFVCSSAAFYRWVEVLDPDMFSEIQARVREGRWIPVGGWWIEPDCNLPCLESFIRQQLYGQRYFRGKLGVMARMGFNPDSFGHHAMLPQVLSGGGMTGYAFLRPGPHEKELPADVFAWQSPDGSRVTACRIPQSYNGDGEELIHRLDKLSRSVPSLMVFFGVGNHGGGPTIQTLKMLEAYRHDSGSPAGIVYENPADFLGRAGDGGLPVVADELQHHARGCYSVMSGIKAWNRRAEGALLSAEMWASAAAMAGAPQPPEAYRQAWENVLFNQFHDILAGSSLSECYDHARDQLGEARAIAARGQNDSLTAVTARIGVPADPGAYPVIVFNPLDRPVCELVETEIFGAREGLTVADENGRPVDSQTVQNKGVLTSDRRVGFFARVPALGWRAYRLRPGAPAAAEPMAAGDGFMENQFFRLEAHARGGCIARLYDKVRGREVFAAPAAAAVVYDDPSDTWSHGVDRWDRELGRFADGSARLIEHGALRCTLRLTARWGESVLVQDVSLYRDIPRVDVRVTLEWRGHNQLLKLRFPTALHEGTATWEIPGGAIVRGNDGDEEPMGRWLDVSGAGEGWGLSIINDALGSGDVNGTDMGLTVLRCPPYAHHDPARLDPQGVYEWMDQGVHTFRYGLIPHAGDWRQGGAVRQADGFNRPPVVQRTHFHTGPLPGAGTMLSVDCDHVMVTALKDAEDGGALILRAREIHGQPAQTVIGLPMLDREIPADFGPWQIRTWRIPMDNGLPVQEVNLLEWTREEMQ